MAGSQLTAPSGPSAIAIGQQWTTRGGSLVKVHRYNEGVIFCWGVYDVNEPRKTWSLNSDGRRAIEDTEWDIVHLIADAAGAPDTKLSNPKEAMGDKKVPLWLCSTIAMAHWAAAQVAGYLKYGAWNWRAAGVRASTYLSAMARHLGRYTNGERLDPVDGTHHLGNIMACCAILLEAEALGKLTDDRPPKADAALAKALEEVEGICARLKVQYADKTPKHWTIEDAL